MVGLNLSRWIGRFNPVRHLARVLPGRRWQIVIWVEEADLVPARLPRRGAALVGPPAAPKWLALDCPCSTGHRLLVNLDSRRRPAWRLACTSPLTIQPSLDITHGHTRCHFTITSGTVRWNGSSHQAHDRQAGTTRPETRRR